MENQVNSLLKDVGAILARLLIAAAAAQIYAMKHPERWVETTHRLERMQTTQLIIQLRHEN
jgi:hypothetical protein